MAAELKCYSREELAEFEQIILEKITKVKNKLALVRDAFIKLKSSSLNNIESSDKKQKKKTYTKEEDGLRQAATEQLKYLNQLEYALIRIKNGSYGINIATGKLIPKKALMKNPIYQTLVVY